MIVIAPGSEARARAAYARAVADAKDFGLSKAQTLAELRRYARKQQRRAGDGR